MPNKTEVIKIIKLTRVEQAIMLTGIHGIGKSSIIASEMAKEGYTTITLFLGQKADPGDIIGLPHKHEITEPDGRKTWVTSFAAMDWWPRDPNGKYVIFLDELNRAKSEMMQCIMDLVLNRKMNGRDLPVHTRIVAAINPSNDGQYQVEDLDPALLDRFRVYELKPTVDEWISWAIEEKLHPAVIGFITKTKDGYLDPPTDQKDNQVGPSRRSWHSLSNDLIKYPELLEDPGFLQTYCTGCVGVAASAAFRKYLSEMNSGLSAKLILENWDRKIESDVMKLNQVTQISLMDECVTYFKSNLDKLLEDQDEAKKVCKNLQYFMEKCLVETNAHFLGKFRDSHKNGERWPKMISTANRNLAEKFVKIQRGEQV